MENSEYINDIDWERWRSLPNTMTKQINNLIQVFHKLGVIDAHEDHPYYRPLIMSHGMLRKRSSREVQYNGSWMVESED